MKELENYLHAIEVLEHRKKIKEIFNWIFLNFPQLDVKIKWNQPMFLDHGTFIIGFSMAKNHLSFTPEEYSINRFSEDIKNAGYEHTKGLAKIKWFDEVNYELLKKIMKFNIQQTK